MDELNNGLQAQTNEMRILLEQAGDIARSEEHTSELQSPS